MQSPDLSSEALLIRSQLKSLTEAFDFSIKKDLPLGEVKKIFHEMQCPGPSRHFMAPVKKINDKSDEQDSDADTALNRFINIREDE